MHVPPASRRLLRCACVACTEGESGQHFRDFCDGDVDQDLAGFEDEVEDERREAPPGTLEEPGAEEARAQARAEEEASDAVAEEILRDATEHGVDEERSTCRPAPEVDPADELEEEAEGVHTACSCRPYTRAMQCTLLYLDAHVRCNGFNTFHAACTQPDLYVRR